jgi:hypothetical protein
MLKHRGAVLVLIGLVSLAGYVGWLEYSSITHSTVQAHCTKADQNDPNCADGDTAAGLNNVIGEWVQRNHETIKSLTPIAAVGGATALLVAIGGLWGATNRLAASTIELREIVREQVEETHEYYTLFEKCLKIIEKHILILERQAAVAEQQYVIDRLQFLATHRPRIMVKAFKAHLEDIEDGKCPVRFVYLNEGSSDALIKEIGSAVFCGPGPWNYRAREVRFDVEIKNIILKGGRSEIATTKSVFPTVDVDSTPRKDDGINWFCVGYVKYQGADDTFDWSTGFCRKWDFESHTWERYPDEEREFAY